MRWLWFSNSHSGGFTVVAAAVNDDGTAAKERTTLTPDGLLPVLVARQVWSANECCDALKKMLKDVRLTEKRLLDAISPMV